MVQRYLVNSEPSPLTPLHLEAVYEWIRGGAPQDLVVEGTSALLGSCLPESDPLIVPTPEPPAAGQGIQLQQTARPLPAQSESEVCMVSYYDATEFVPEEARIPCPPRYAFEEGVRGIQNPDSQCFAYKRTTLIQDPQSHHEIVLAYAGFADTDDPAWGAWTKKFRDVAHPEQGQASQQNCFDSSSGPNPKRVHPLENYCEPYGAYPDPLG